MKSAALAALCISSFAFASLAQDSKPWSGNEQFRYCKMASRMLNESITLTPQEAMSAGGCWGVLAGIWYMSDQLSPQARFCPPKGATPGQAFQIVVKHLEDNPTLLHLDVREVMVDCLRKTWPCT